jgi:peptidoglycan/LPS O-acetylase OafA/YrhL
MITACALLSAALMAILYNPSADPSRVYYGTDTRAFELLTGSFLAVVLAGRKPFTGETSEKHKNGLSS